MTDDPERWIDDDDAPPALRAYLKRVAPPSDPLPEPLRARVREMVVEMTPAAPDPRDDARGVAPSDPRPRGRGALAFALLAAALLLLGLALFGPDLVGPVPSVEPDLPAVAPEPSDAGPDAPALEPIEVERICGDREDSDGQCDLVARGIEDYDRLELHAATGIRPPPCGGVAEQQREPAEGMQRFVLSDGASERGWRAFTVCGYRDGELRGVGSIEGRRNVPHLSLGRRRGGDDVRIPLEAIDDDITGVRVSWVPPAPDDTHWSGIRDGCPGQPVIALSRAELEPLLGREGLSYFQHVVVPDERVPTFVLCTLSEAGTHHVRMPYRFPEDEQPFLRTRSGEVSLDQVVGELVAVGPEGSVTVTYLDASWPGSAANRRRSERLRAQMEDVGASPPRELVLANGRVVWLPAGATLGPRSVPEPRIATLRDGSTSAIVSERVLTASAPEDHDHERRTRDAVLTTASEASIYLDDVVVAAFSTGASPPRPFDDTVEPIRVVPRVAYECSVEVLLELDAVPSVIEAVGIAFVRHAGEADLDARPAIDCASASIAMELPASALAALPPDGDGVRRLALTFSDAPDDFDDLGDEGDSYCSTPYAVIACVRDASGLHALPGATGRWAQSGMACFSGDTPISTEDGTVPIASLRPGMRVMGFDPNRGEAVVTEVTRLIPRGERAILTLALSNGSSLRVTAEHPLFDPTTGIFRRAETFAMGDPLRGLDGQEVRVMAIEARGERAAVFDLSVRGPHTYFAGGILAHNY